MIELLSGAILWVVAKIIAIAAPIVLLCFLIVIVVCAGWVLLLVGTVVFIAIANFIEWCRS